MSRITVMSPNSTIDLKQNLTAVVQIPTNSPAEYHIHGKRYWQILIGQILL